jgi:hypothetical protein
MKRRLSILMVLLALAGHAAASASGAAPGVTIRGATVNRDQSVTIGWSLGNPNVSNSWISVDGRIVRSGSDRATWFTTAPLSGGSHTITIEVREIYETYTASGSSSQVSGGHRLCVQSSRSSISVNVPLATNTQYVVPRVLGLQLRVAKARITGAGCSLGAVKLVDSTQPAGTVLAQGPKMGKLLSKGAPVRLVVSNGHSPTKSRTSPTTEGSS